MTTEAVVMDNAITFSEVALIAASDRALSGWARIGKPMMPCMVTALQEREVVRAIVGSRFVSMVDMFSREQAPSDHRLHYQAMLEYVAVWPTVRMVGPQNQDIPVGIQSSPGHARGVAIHKTDRQALHNPATIISLGGYWSLVATSAEAQLSINHTASIA